MRRRSVINENNIPYQKKILAYITGEKIFKIRREGEPLQDLIGNTVITTNVIPAVNIMKTTTSGFINPICVFTNIDSGSRPLIRIEQPKTSFEDILAEYGAFETCLRVKINNTISSPSYLDTMGCGVKSGTSNNTSFVNLGPLKSAIGFNSAGALLQGFSINYNYNISENTFTVPNISKDAALHIRHRLTNERIFTAWVNGKMVHNTQLPTLGNIITTSFVQFILYLPVLEGSQSYAYFNDFCFTAGKTFRKIDGDYNDYDKDYNEV